MAGTRTGGLVRRLFEFLGLVVAVVAIGYGLVLLANLRVLFLEEAGFSPWGLLLIVTAGVVGITGAVLYLRALRSPGRTPTLRRLLGWLMMMAMFFLPTSLWLFFLAFGLLAIPAIPPWPAPGDRR